MRFGSRRKNEPAEPARDELGSARHELLGMLRDQIAASAPDVGADETWISEDPPPPRLVSTRGWTVMVLPDTHANDHWHFDIGFIHDLRAPEHDIVPDCIFGPLEDVAQIWRETSGACLLEILTQRGAYAEHYHAADPRAIPGWHTITSGVLGYSYGGTDESNHLLQEFMWNANVLRRLAPLILPLLDRPRYNGIKVFYMRAPAEYNREDGQPMVEAEVRINGEPAPEASAALASLDWPEVPVPTFARFYAVALHPETTPHATVNPTAEA